MVKNKLQDNLTIKNINLGIYIIYERDIINWKKYYLKQMMQETEHTTSDVHFKWAHVGKKFVRKKDLLRTHRSLCMFGIIILISGNF